MQPDDYRPGGWQVSIEQVRLYEMTLGMQGNTADGLPIVILTMRGARTGTIRKAPIMRVERDGVYAAVASAGGQLRHPPWYYNLLANPDVLLQDGPRAGRFTARLFQGAERAEWWNRVVATYPRYEEYRRLLVGVREIPVFGLEAARIPVVL